MANRVLLGVNGLRVSKPGIDVLTAGLGELNFASEWSGMTLLMTGQLSLPANSPTQTVLFGKTFNRVPYARLMNKQLSGSTDLGWIYTTLNAATLQPDSAFRIYTNRMEFENPTSVSYRISYRIWDYNP